MEEFKSRVVDAVKEFTGIADEERAAALMRSAHGGYVGASGSLDEAKRGLAIAKQANQAAHGTIIKRRQVNEVRQRVNAQVEKIAREVDEKAAPPVQELKLSDDEQVVAARELGSVGRQVPGPLVESKQLSVAQKAQKKSWWDRFKSSPANELVTPKKKENKVASSPSDPKESEQRDRLEQKIKLYIKILEDVISEDGFLCSSTVKAMIKQNVADFKAQKSQNIQELEDTEKVARSFINSTFQKVVDQNKKYLQIAQELTQFETNDGKTIYERLASINKILTGNITEEEIATIEKNIFKLKVGLLQPSKDQLDSSIRQFDRGRRDAVFSKVRPELKMIMKVEEISGIKDLKEIHRVVIKRENLAKERNELMDALNGLFDYIKSPKFQNTYSDGLKEMRAIVQREDYSPLEKLSKIIDIADARKKRDCSESLSKWSCCLFGKKGRTEEVDQLYQHIKDCGEARTITQLRDMLQECYPTRQQQDEAVVIHQRHER